MNKSQVGLALLQARRKAGLKQVDVAARMHTTQSVISRAESGQVLPTLEFLKRFAGATGQEIQLTIKPGRDIPKRNELRRRVKAATKGFVFNPWDRDPTAAEQKSLLADRISRERFEGKRASQTR